MHYALLFFPLLLLASSSPDSITNNSDKDMLCVAKYDALYGEKEVDGHKQRVVTQPMDYIQAIEVQYQ